MTAAPPPAWRVAWLLTRLRLRRLLNMLGSIRRRKPGPRSGTRPKRRGSALLAGVVVLMMALTYGNLAHQALSRLAELVSDPAAGVDGAFGAALLQVLSVEVALLTVAGLLMTVGSRELAQADWDLEWLVGFPAEIGTLLWSRVAERSVANGFGLLALWPTCTVLAWQAGFRWSALPVGLLAALPLLALTAMAQTLVDTGLRLRLGPSRLRNLQAVISVASILVFYLTISPAMPGGGAFLMQIAQAVPAAICWTPPGLVLQALGAETGVQAAASTGLLLAETLLLLAAGMRLLRHLLAQGVAAAGVRESGRAKAARPSQAPASARWRLASPVQRRELMLLARDRNFLVQTTVLPVLIVGLQWVLNGRFDSFAQVWSDPQTVAAGVFGIAANALMLSAFQTLSAEGGALWLLYSFPCAIESVLRDKARLWGLLVLVYPLLGFACVLAFGPPAGWTTLGLFAMVALGVPIYATIAVALGVFGCDPLATDARQRVRPSWLYLFLLLSGLYAYALFAPRWWQSLVFVVLSALLALALWQKARDQLPYLLDPVAGPPARVSTADGLVAAMLFFVLQVITSALLRALDQPLQGPQIVFAFAVAGALTYLGVRFTQWRARMREVPAMFGAGWLRALAGGAGLGIFAAAIGIAYLQAVQMLGLLEEASEAARSAGATPLGAWMLPLGVLAAPLFEEYIFRGLIFGGLRRSLRWLPAAAASAAVFAIVHPPLSMLPVFALGMVAAWAYERSHLLLAPMLVHAVYNAAVIGWQGGVLVR